MFDCICKIFTNKHQTPQEIEVEFEKTRANYNSELSKLRSKYAATFLALSNKYRQACIQK